MYCSKSQSRSTDHNIQGFTLLELSIVLIIIALVMGGVISGRNLLEAAEKRSIYTSAQTYISATVNFVDKYGSLPGDMYDAENVWGQAASGNTCKTTSTGDKKTCDGNGDGQIALGETDSNNATSDKTVEHFRAWQQLVSANLMQSDTMTGTPGAGGDDHAIPGQNVPRGPISGSGYTLYYQGAGDAGAVDPFFGVDNEVYGHILNFGLYTAAGVTDDPILLPQEAWEVDNKVDDGLPYSGIVRTYQLNTHANCATADDATAVYQVTYEDGRTCNLIFITGF